MSALESLVSVTIKVIKKVYIMYLRFILILYYLHLFVQKRSYLITNSP